MPQIALIDANLFFYSMPQIALIDANLFSIICHNCAN
jgi:hypothetical protein